ncbi:MAG TPA: DoxX family protein, partial [Afipia sp.]
SGASKLYDIAGMIPTVENHIVIPDQLATYKIQIETMTGMAIAQVIVIATGVFEILCGLLIALNFGARVVSILLALFVVATIYYFHNFWTMTDPDRTINLYQALKNLSLIGGLLMIAGYPRPEPPPETTNYHGV